VSDARQGPAVLVTGAARRIGRAIAERFAEAGWHVVAHSRSPQGMDRAWLAGLGSAESVHFDLRDSDEVRRVVAHVGSRLGDWRALVCNAACFKPDRPEGFDRAVFEEALNVNLRGNIELSAAFLAAARAHGGKRVVHLLDQKIANLNPDFFSYTLAKSALASAVTMQAMAAGESGDRIFGLAPGLAQPSFDQTDSEFRRSGNLNLLGRYNDPREIADAAWFLATGPLATGTVLFADSGQHLCRQPRDVMFEIRKEAS
jgi:NAD(P)-dependent dehydrogenase (short-subunit alcohol dehydrogenase family)